MKDFKDLFTSEGLLEKMAGVWVNKEGIFNYSPDDGPEMLRHFADLTSRLGLEIAGLRLPLIGSRRENAITLKIDGSMSEGPRAEISGGGLLISAPDHAGLDRMIKAFVLGPDEAGSSAGEYDTHANVAPRLDLNEDFRVLWSDDWALDPEAALEFFARTAMDSFTACFPYTADAEEEGRRYLKIDAGDGSGACAGDCAACCGDWVEFCENGDITVHRYSSEGAARLAAGYAASLQTLKDIKGDYWLSDLEDVLAGRNDLGQMVAAGACCEAGCGTDGCCPDADCCTDEPCRLVTRENSRAIVDREKWSELTGIMLARHNDPKPIRSWEYEEEWEGETFLKAFREKLAGVRPGSVVDVEGILSEDLDVRQDLERELRALIEGAGAVPGEVRVYRSFKSGISWIEEKVIPELAALDRKPDRIDIEFRYFMNEKGDDAFEDESVPNYGVNLDKPDKWFDIPTRWLQELHPVDELIEAKLGLPKEAVNFLRSDDQSRTYRLTAYCGDEAVWTGDFTTAFVKKHYMNRYPLIGWTHVSTGHLLVKEDGAVTLDARIATDMEKLWGHLEDEVLPDLEEYLVAKYGKADLPAMQPLFGRLDIDVRMSEMDYDIGTRNERISMLESMQEDIYFYILDWFKTYGERECGKALDNVGLIFPKPENGKRQPSVMKIVLSDELSDGAKFICGGSEEPVEELENSVRLAGVSFGEDGTPCVCLEVCPEDPADAAALENRLKTLAGYVEKGIAVYPSEKPVRICAEVAGGSGAAALIPAYRRKAPDLTEEERLDILKHRVVDYPTYMRLLDYYAAKPEFRVLPVGTTYKGRKLYAVEAVKKPEGVCWSRYKLQTARITALFNARHHGNESTSLNSGFMLLDRVLEDPELGELTDRLNIISVPWENVDGGEMHCEIYEKHPKWLAHIARYNSVGFEFRKDFGNLATKYGEARIVRELWEKWLPDIVTDNHGFEGHELCQPFSGYISPWYKSFWIPRALYYGYIWFDSRVPHLESFGSAVREKVSRAITGDSDIHAWNEICTDRFDKYARNWFPELFASPKHNDVVFYWMDTAVHPRAYNFAVSNPEITVIDWTTEVADETVTGEDFWLNAKAHLISDLALLDVIKETPVKVDCRPCGEGLIKIRHKPLYTE